MLKGSTTIYIENIKKTDNYNIKRIKEISYYLNKRVKHVNKIHFN